MVDERASALTSRRVPPPRGRTILALLACVVVFDAFVFPTVARRIARLSDGRGFLPLDLRFSYTPDQAYTVIGSLTPDARRLYAIVELSADVLYPLAYALFLYLLAWWLLARRAGYPRWIERATMLPFAAMLADWLENAAIVTLIAVYPQRADSVAWLASGLTTIKSVCLPLAIVLVLYAATRALVSRRARASASP